MHIKEQIEEFAKSLGFDLVGFSPATIAPHYLNSLDAWLTNDHQGTMRYMEKVAQRRDLGLLLPGAESVICVAMNYYRPQAPLSPKHGRVARYAFGRDYHKIITKKLKQLETFLHDLAPEHQHKRYVDTGPLLERALAEQAGLGIIGKNACLITRDYGSWVFLAEIITTLPLHSPSSAAPKSDRWQADPKSPAKVCGNCTKCLDACPTGAIIAPGVIDSRLCISYLTIENKDQIPDHLAKKIAETKRIYGCDICQEVCPHNMARQEQHHHSELNQEIAGDQLPISTAKKTPKQFLETFAGSPIMRAKSAGLARSLKIISVHGE